MQQAYEAVRTGQFDRALELTGQILAMDPNLAEAYVLRGIALASTSSPEAATESFQRAIALDPRNAKAYFNLAVHWFNLGRLEEAKVMANQALSLDPGHAQARDLVANIERLRGAASQEHAGFSPNAPQGPPPPTSGEYSQTWSGPEAPPRTVGHSLPIVGQLGAAWGLLFWLLFAGMVLSIGYAIGQFGPMFDLIMQGAKESEVMAKATEIQTSPQYALLGLISNACWIGLIIWGIMDIIDRRSSWAWLLLFVCCTILIPLYWFLGRPSWSR